MTNTITRSGLDCFSRIVGSELSGSGDGAADTTIGALDLCKDGAADGAIGNIVGSVVACDDGDTDADTATGGLDPCDDCDTDGAVGNIVGSVVACDDGDTDADTPSDDLVGAVFEFGVSEMESDVVVGAVVGADVGE